MYHHRLCEAHTRPTKPGQGIESGGRHQTWKRFGLSLSLAAVAMLVVATSATADTTTGNLLIGDKRPCQLLPQSSQLGSAWTLRCSNVTVAHVNDNYLRVDKGAHPLCEILLEHTISGTASKQYLAVAGQQASLEIFKFVHSNVTNEHLDSLLAHRSYANLRALDLSGNLISRVQHLGPGMARLTILRLSNNAIDGLSADVFGHVEQLNELYLDGNRLRSIMAANTEDTADTAAAGGGGAPNEPDGLLFAHLRNLYVLDLSHNQLDDLPRNVFTGLGQLKTLDLSRNRLAIVPFQVSRECNSINRRKFD